jgi:DUF971 family protein
MNYDGAVTEPRSRRQSALGPRDPRRLSFVPRLPRKALHSESIPVSAQQPAAVRPTEIVLHQQSRILEVAFADGRRFRLPCEFLRVFSPSAEVRGHGPGQDVLQTGKKEVAITAVEPVGNYAVKLVFSDGHDSGLYSWEYLYALGSDQQGLWQQYLDRLQQAGASRDA